VSAGLKLPFLFFATFASASPHFFGQSSSVTVAPVAGGRVVFGAFALTSVLLAAFVPITAFFLITGANYYFQLLTEHRDRGVRDCSHVSLHEGSAWSAKSAAYTLAKPLRSCARGGVVRLRRIQLAWSLRPSRRPQSAFQVFGRYQATFTRDHLRREQALARRGKPTVAPAKQDTIPRFRGFIIPPIDTVADSTERRKRHDRM